MYELEGAHETTRLSTTITPTATTTELQLAYTLQQGKGREKEEPFRGGREK